MGRGRLSDFEKGRICSFHEAGWSNVDIGKKIGRPESTVRGFLKRVESRGHIADAHASGRPRKTTAITDRRIVRMAKANRRITAKEIQQHLPSEESISERSIQRRLNTGGLRGGWSLKKPLISEKNRKRRVAWAKEHLQWTTEQWKRVLWSDESPFVIYGTARQRVWRLPNERYSPTTTRATVKHSVKVMVWGCFAASGVGTLHLIEGTMDRNVYKNILIHQMKPSAKKIFQDDKFIFQHDNDPKHTAKCVKSYLEKQSFETMSWPAQSPDLNPIENLWAIIEYRLRDRRCSSAQDLYSAIKTEWERLEPSLLENLIESMHRRCQAVIDSNGFPTKY